MAYCHNRLFALLTLVLISAHTHSSLLDAGYGQRAVSGRLGVELDLVEDAPDHGAAVDAVHAVVHVVVERRFRRLKETDIRGGYSQSGNTIPYFNLQSD